MRSRLLVVGLVVSACTPTVNLPPVGDAGGGSDGSVADVPAADVTAPLDATDAGGADVGSDAAPVLDAATDTPAVLDGASVDVARDVPIIEAGGSCHLNADCPGGVCDHAHGVCVACVTAADCADSTQVCQANRCVAATTCASSRACPGQVCDIGAGRCVDCVTNVDCTGGAVCRRGSCLPAPATCRSSRECNTLEQVCDTAHGVCVDCVADTDCLAGQYCAADQLCVRQACTPNAVECVDLAHVRNCDARGTAWTSTTCGSGQSCSMGTCRMQICAPGSITMNRSAKSLCAISAKAAPASVQRARYRPARRSL